MVKADIGAQIVISLPAKNARTAYNDRLQDNAIPGLKLGYFPSNLDDFPGQFMPDGSRQGGKRVGPPVCMDVAAADGHSLCFDKNLGGGGGRNRKIHKLYRSWCGNRGHGIGVFHFNPEGQGQRSTRVA
jgi:hypothetical protein